MSNAEKPDFSELEAALEADTDEGEDYEDPGSLSEEQLEKLKEESGQN